MEVFFILITASLFLLALGSLLLSWSASSWPMVEGCVVESRVERRIWERNDHEFGHTYHPVVRYEYVVAGKKHLGGTIDHNFTFDFLKYAFDPKEAANTCSKYPAGTVVAVAYSPTFPSISVLDRAVVWWFKISIALALGVLLTAQIALFIRNAKREHPVEPPPLPTKCLKNAIDPQMNADEHG